MFGIAIAAMHNDFKPTAQSFAMNWIPVGPIENGANARIADAITNAQDLPLQSNFGCSGRASKHD
jgi:hypothetical protein